MSPHESMVQPVRSSSEMERENAELRFRLLKAEEAVRELRSQTFAKSTAEQIEESLRESEARLAMELADTKLLQSISAHLIHEENIDALYTKITEAALTVMQSDFATMQMYFPERGSHGQLHMLAAVGLSQEGQDFWEWVDDAAGTTCAVAMRTGRRFMSADMATCEFVVGTPDHAMFAQAGVLAAQSTPLFSRGGNLLGMISTHWTRHHTPSDRDLNLLDILARQAADLIERKIAEDALKKSQAALIAEDRRKDEFLATLAHELRNPLSPITSALQVLRMGPQENQEEILNMMDRQIGHLVRIIDDLLDVSRIRQGKIDLRKRRIAIQTAVRDAIEASTPLLVSKEHQLVLHLPEDPIWVFADLTRMAQVVGNLINNAAKYTPRNGTVTISVNAEEDHVVCSVSDSGIGIPQDMLPKIFELFAQVDNHLERSQGGLGIGLSLVKRLLEMHDGNIEVQSMGTNRGSIFTVRLPIA